MSDTKLAAYLASISGAEGDLFVVPTIYREELAFAPLALDVVKHARGKGVAIRTPPEPSTLPHVELRNDVLFLPAFYFVATNPELTNAVIAIWQNMLSSYLYDRLKALVPGRRPDASIRLFMKKGDDVFDFSYSGPADAVPQLTVAEIVQRFRPLADAPKDTSEPALLPREASTPPASSRPASPRPKARPRGK